MTELTTGETEKLIKKFRQLFAEYRQSEGCSCCENIDVHKRVEKKIANLLKPEPYSDGSGWDWKKYIKPKKKTTRKS